MKTNWKDYCGDKKYLTVKLDSSDDYATYIYKLDGNEVMGDIKVREGQVLTLEYTLTDDTKSLSESSGMLWWKSEKKVTKEIVMTANIDGKVITRYDFGIKLKGE